VAAAYTRALGLLYEMMISEGRATTEWRPTTAACRGGLSGRTNQRWGVRQRSDRRRSSAGGALRITSCSQMGGSKGKCGGR
jgi:hypothetical protein